MPSTGESGHTQTITARLENNDENLAQTIAHSASIRPTGERGMKFEYASGSKPLEGFTIKRGVGIGGFGEVYFAVSDAGKEVALKRVQRNLDIEVRGVSQCLNLKHANLVGLFDIKYDEEGGAWVVMEYIGGESLRDVLERHPNGMPLAEVKRLISEMAAGVGYLHDHGIVHRDLKPGNIFCDEGTIKIGDYGLSKFISCSRRSGQTESVGTCHYMAPEIGKGVYGKEIDIYAMGVILFEMITGRLPFEGESSQEIIMKHLTAEPDLNGIPQPFRTVIRKALFKDPARRFDSVTEMIAQLDAGGGNEPGPSSKANGVLTSHMAADPEVPPIISNPGNAGGEPLYIGEDAPHEMHFGPVRQVPPGQQRPHHSTAQPSRQPSRRTPARSIPTATVVAPRRNSEPIAGAVKQGIGNVSYWWTNSSLSSPFKVALVIAAVFAIALNSRVFVPLAIALGAAYLIYAGIRYLMMAGEESATDTESRRRTSLGEKPMVHSFAELTGSFLSGAVVTAVMVAAMMLLADEAFRDVSGNRDLSRFAWLTISSISCVWLVLGVGRIWQRRPDDSIAKRVTLGISGALVGVGAFVLGEFLHVPLPANTNLDAGLFPAQIQQELFLASESPTLLGQIVFFGGLLMILRWWKQADPVRTTRASLLATGCCVLWSWIIPYPQPWGFMIAAATSVGIQLSAPWLSPRQRTQLAQTQTSTSNS